MRPGPFLVAHVVVRDLLSLAFEFDGRSYFKKRPTGVNEIEVALQ